ncbi:PREDICTED: doublesex- and mab-3-related transcription factor 2 [Gekko japonicus]|uniref:Doublesex- and mab-3-related transcription factor 2 n=1 Tax=Gekko japonicus TaxID=146911 RepID=A0ABM1L608_GEKJA|nr:PREDICTED: doublesex- and mab-3-related transcription factor 2 [Gekko japonicus]
MSSPQPQRPRARRTRQNRLLSEHDADVPPLPSDVGLATTGTGGVRVESRRGLNAATGCLCDQPGARRLGECASTRGMPLWLTVQMTSRSEVGFTSLCPGGQEKEIIFVHAFNWDKKGLTGKQANFERKTVYQRHVRTPSLLAKSILEGYRPIAADPYLGGNSPLPPPVSDRMRKRRAFADKELENIMLEREYKEREMMEATQAAAFFLPNRMGHGSEYNSYKTAFSPNQIEASNKEFCNFLPTCLDLTMQYSGSGNMELISSNVSVATTYRQYPIPSRLLVWPKCGPLNDALLYQQCLLNATTVQALKPGAVWDSKASQETQPSQNELQQTPQENRERSAFSPPMRTFSHISEKDSLAAQEHSLRKINKESIKPHLPPPLKYSPFHSLFQQALHNKSGPEVKTFDEASKKYREFPIKESQKYKFAIDRYAKDFLGTKQIITKLSTNEPLSFSVESILKRPSSMVTNVTQ